MGCGRPVSLHFPTLLVWGHACMWFLSHWGWVQIPVSQMGGGSLARRPWLACAEVIGKRDIMMTRTRARDVSIARAL